MKIKPEDRPKMIGLMTAIGIMFCYLILVVVPSLSGAQAAPAPQDTPGTAPAAPVPPAGAPSPAPSLSKSGSAMMEAQSVPDASHDPFLSPTPNPATAAPVTPAVVPASPATPATAKPIPGAGAAPPAASQTALQTAPKVPQPSLILLGVADGDEQVAVFQIGENTLEKKKGDKLPGGFILQAIDGDGVMLARDKAVCRVEVGHTF